MIYWIVLISQALAEDHGGGHAAASGHQAAGIPWSSIFVQTFNISFLLIILFVIMRKSVKAHFEHRARDYQQLVSRAETARLDAEKGKTAVKERLAKLESTAGQVEQQARSEAQELRGRMLAEGKTLSARLQQEAERTVKVEVEKAKAQMRKELLENAITDARENLKKNLSSSEQQKLQREFAEKIQVVGG